MDYGPMIALHDDRGADITIGVVRVPIAAADKFGVLSLDDSNRVVRFEEKPAKPQPIPGSPEVAYASMGIYVFNAALLEQLLLADAADATSGHDFGQHIIPATIEHLKVFAYPFTDVQTRAQSYWRDVGTVDAYYDANMELVHVEPELNLYDEEWPIWTYQSHQPPAKFVLNDHGRRGMAINSLVSGGCIVSGALIEQSMLFSGVHVHEHSHLLGSVVLPDTRIGPGCNIHRAIIDEGCDVPAGLSVGQDRARDAAHFHVTENGVVLITRQMLQARTRLEA
jgi:glucose-1-phosphate adenylyltransferase